MTRDGIVRWIARLWSVASFLLIAAFMFGGAEHLRPTASEATAMALFPIGVLIGFGIAWRRELLGGSVSIASLAAFYGLLWLRSGKLPGGPYFLLFSAPGFLFVLAAVLSPRPSDDAPNA